MMPFITFESTQLTGEVKERLIEELTETSVRVTGIPKALFLVSIHEQSDQNIAIGGKSISKIKQEMDK